MIKKKAFTLLEMIIVMMIIATIFILSIPNVSDVIHTVDNKACKALTSIVDSAIVEFKLEFGQMPGSIYDLVNAGYLTDDQIKCPGGEELKIVDGKTTY